MKGENVYDNRTEHEKAEIPYAGNGDEDTPNQFESLHESEVSGLSERPHEKGDGRTISGRWRHGHQLEQDNQRKDDKEKT